jgi:hypothetical protein
MINRGHCLLHFHFSHLFHLSIDSSINYAILKLGFESPLPQPSDVLHIR